MAAPLKPWEKIGTNQHTQDMPFSTSMSSVSDFAAPQEYSRSAIPSVNINPPTLPPRASHSQGSNFTPGLGGSYGSGYGSYGGMGGMGGGMYGSGMYGGYGGGYGGGMNGGYSSMNRFGADNNYTTNSFVRQAEQNSRQAFQSVESVVQAFGSVAMMLDSTFFAVTNSFRAVIGVADQMSRVKTHLTQIISALAVFKTLRWILRRFLVLLRLRKSGLPDDVWSEASADGLQSLMSNQELQGGKKSSWPIMLFFAIVIGGPWMIWKLLSSIYSNGESEWASGKDGHFLGIGEHSFTGQNEDELSFNRGQRITIAPKDIQPQVRGWLLASVDGLKTGLVPANYIKILGKRKGSNETETSASNRRDGNVGVEKPVNFDNEFRRTVDPSPSQNLEQAFSELSQTSHEKTANDILNDL